MDRRFGLVLLWAVFAAAAVGVGFAAAGLVGDPLTSGVPAGPAADVGNVSPATPSPSGSPSTGRGTSSPLVSQTSAAGRSTTRSIATPGGLVSATCSGERVSVSASPSLGWEVDDLDTGARSNARVRFERTGDRDGRVEVRTQCSESGAPTFEVEDRSSDEEIEFED